ncbi:MAG: HNH endonuclease [Lewinellaceae bacterium]|nr:HNH endonuclease [Saprospiraceae bacterium]MCB9331010.1 HNH endonuclease [Lewinellaceae bacterium]
MKYTYSREQLEDAVLISTSIRQVLTKLELKEAGGNYQTIKRRISEWKINTSHFTGKGWNQALFFKPNPKKPIQEYLVKNSNYQSHKLRVRLIREGYFQEKCYRCNRRQWMGEKIPLELEHKDGDRMNNELSNLTLLCPNCHALTKTWRRRKK